MHVVLVAQDPEQIGQVLLRRVGRQLVVERLHPGLAARLALVAHVDLGGGVVSDENRREARPRSAGGDQLLHADPCALAHLRGHRFSVDDVAHFFLRGA